MELPALSIRQPDLGRTLAQIATMKTATARNRLLQDKAGKDKYESGLVSQIVGGGQPGADDTLRGGTASAAGLPSVSAMQQLIASNPPLGMKMQDYLDKTDDRKLAKDARDNKEMARLMFELGDMPEEQRPLAYAQTIKKAREMGLPVDDAPAQYSEAWRHKEIREAMTLDQLMKEQESKRPTKANTVKVQTGSGPKLRPMQQTIDENLTLVDEEQTGPQKDATALGLKPGSDEYNSYIRDRTLRAGVQVNMGTEENARSKAYGKQIGEHYGKTFTGLQEGASQARAQSGRLDRLDQLLDQTKTGAFAGTITDIKKAAQTFNIDLSSLPENVGPAEAAEALANEMALELRNPAGGAGMPGAMSDKDREFLQSMVPGINQTREGRKLLIASRRKVNQRSVEVARLARNYAKKHGQLDGGFDDVLQDYADKNPLFNKEDLGMREKARLPRVANEADYSALAPGTYYTSPDGQVRQKAKQ